ncbi:LamG-like jellyroll fold domain-containing protein, partial [uncultured Lutibacter sp.]|uniref:LamG-like jellyroll fold domain-containing protein n=1 Tax=uncultured Lutibacter sp. TaxID=437739 RepID=UPI00261C09DD
MKIIITLFILFFSVCTSVFSQTVIHSADFEGGLDGWTQVSGDDFDWTRDSGGTPSGNTGPSTGASGNYYMYTEASSNYGKIANFDSPSFNLLGTVNPKFIFYYHMYGSDMGSLYIDISTDGGATYSTNLWSNTGEVQKANNSIWIPVSINLSAYIGLTVKIRIRGLTGSYYASDMAIDNITLIDKANPIIGPGGITTDLQLWLKSTSGLGYTNGQGVSLWADQGRGSDATVHTTGQEPTYRDAAAYNVNFNPVVDFDNDYNNVPIDYAYNDTSRQFLEGANGFYSEDIFVVVIPDVTVSSASPSMDTFCADSDTSTQTEDATGIGFGKYTGRIDNEIITYAYSTYNKNIAGDGYAVAEVGTGNTYANIGIINTRNNSLNSQQELYYNATNIETTQNDTPKHANVNDASYLIGRSEGWKASLDGRVAEIITYSARKNDASLTTERNKIQSYLAIKYGITLGINGISQDYVDSAGNVIWDQSANTGYNYDIAGIGQDDDSELIQKQSKSVNAGSIIAIGLSEVATTNNANANSFASNLDFLVWGSNNGNFNTTSEVAKNVNLSSSITTFTPVSRKWKILETQNDVSEVVISIVTSDLTSNIPLVANEEYMLVVADDASFGSTNIIDVVPLTTNGANSEAWYDFEGTKYFTIAKATRVEEKRRIDFTTGEFLLGDTNLELTTNFTVSAWVKNNTNGGSFISKGTGYNFKINGSKNIEIDWNGSTKITSTNTVDSNWHHIAITFSGGAATLYIDGILDTTVNSLANPISSAQKFAIGALYTNKTTINSFDGAVDEVRFWNSPLTITEIRYIMNQEIVEFGTNVDGEILPHNITKNDISSRSWNTLQAYYDMNSFYGTTVEDNSNNKNWARIKYLAKDKQVVEVQTAPLPYESSTNGNWNTPATWLNNTVQYLPNTTLNGTTVDWNIVQTTHDITSGDKDITVLGLKNNAGKVTIAGTGALDETNNGQGLTVTHYLEIDGVIDLIGESQLIQTDGSILDIDSGGYIERDQQGTANSFNYNYWSSSVGPISGNAGTRGTGIASVNSNNTVAGALLDGSVSATPQNINFNASYASADSGPSSPRTISSFWLYTFNGTSDDYDAWNTINQYTPLKPGEGYTMKGTSGPIAVATNQNYVFKGKPNNGDITLSILAGNDRLIGNPYPSAIDADEFIKDNIKETINSKVGRNTANVFNGALYFWHHFGQENSHILKEYVGGYATYTLIGGAEAISNDSRINNNLSIGGKVPERYIPLNQGFFVHAYLPSSLAGTTATVDGGTIIFKNSQRFFQREVLNSGNGSVFFKTNSKSKANIPEKEKDSRSKIRLVFDSANGYHRQLLIGADKNTSNHFDMGYDAPIADIANEDIFWMVDDSKFVIQGVPNFNVDQQFPLGLKIKEQGLITIKIENLQNMDENTPIYIKDNLTCETYNLSEKDFEINMEPGEYLNRFELAFQPRLKTLKEIYLVDGIFITMNNHTSELQINRIVDTEIINIKLFNFLGQQVESWGGNFNERKFSIPIKKSAGVYILHITT